MDREVLETYLEDVNKQLAEYETLLKQRTLLTELLSTIVPESLPVQQEAVVEPIPVVEATPTEKTDAERFAEQVVHSPRNSMGLPVRGRNGKKQSRVNEIMAGDPGISPKEVQDILASEGMDASGTNVTSMMTRARKKLKVEEEDDADDIDAYQLGEQERCSVCNLFSADVEEIHGIVYCQNCL